MLCARVSFLHRFVYVMRSCGCLLLLRACSVCCLVYDMLRILVEWDALLRVRFGHALVFAATLCSVRLCCRFRLCYAFVACLSLVMALCFAECPVVLRFVCRLLLCSPK